MIDSTTKRKFFIEQTAVLSQDRYLGEVKRKHRLKAWKWKRSKKRQSKAQTINPPPLDFLTIATYFWDNKPSLLTSYPLPSVPHYDLENATSVKEKEKMKKGGKYPSEDEKIETEEK